ncbi:MULTISPECIES: pentapeptide repeat-containing protein [Calothrix]|uniref:Pentapeptide repeat-containing protein n=2 Tax=Calothrix TaxID=1186 RepID=A0ABR8A2E6_9CYAN|nr:MULTISPECIES: pentapeptide repeat-containing protein [Calothrix]MBD2194121.1 pentapeptide repeat-containing protein [Calothrix parietina FACHB-288]MBD2227528.1 pentapeptide repeat-containing protein [Calothrix anomala FACHB-343]
MALATFPNFSGQSLQGRDFRGQNLTGADFSNADIRGANFTDAILKNANFQNAQAGLTIKGVFGLVLLTLLVTELSGFISGFAPVFTGYILFPYSVTTDNLLALIIVISIIIIFAISIINNDLLTTFFRVICTAIFWGFLLGLMTGKIAGIAAGVICIAVTTSIAYVMFTILAFLIFVQAQIAGIIIAIVTLFIMFPSIIFGATSGTVIGVAVAEVFTGGDQLPLFKVRAVQEAAIAATFATIILTFFISYISWRIYLGDAKFIWMQKLAIAVSTLFGTSFKQADLTNANFSNAYLKNINLSNAKLINTNFHLAKKLAFCQLENTILVNPIIRDLSVNKKANNKVFIGCNLKGINLDYADMSYADLTEADISQATFVGATLEGANLTKVQAIATNFQQAKFTAACLESWNIDSTTELTGVICDYVYLLNHQQERRPSSGIFAAGEFTKLFQVAINTVDLIFRNGLNSQALSTALTKVRLENEDSLLAPKSIENKGDNVVVVRVDVAADVNKAKIHAELTQNYELALKSLEAKYQAELKSKDEQIVLYRQHQADLKELMQMIAPTAKKMGDTKLVVLKLTQGNLNTGFSVTLQIGLEGEHPYFESNGKLPPASELALIYNQWQTAYRQSLQGSLRIKISETQVTNISRRELFNECDTAATSLKKQVNLWLDSELFRPLKEQLLEKLNPSDSIRILLQTEDSQLRRIPLHLWNFFERYPQAEIAISSTAYEKREKNKCVKSQVKILAILGDSSGINIQKDRLLLEELPNAEVTFLVEPQRQVLNDELWLQSWDILFFAGHSSTQADAEIGNFRINSTDSLTIAELKNALTKAIEQGLHLAIFNSCDGLGLAVNLADLHIPQMIFMREPVPDKVAQEFLKNFLTEFSSGKPLYLSLRSARSKLQGLENEFPYATWLPVICQNPAEIPLAWYQF